MINLSVVLSIRIKVKSDETFYNYLKKKGFKKSQYLFNEECLKESNNQKDQNENKKELTFS